MAWKSAYVQNHDKTCTAAINVGHTIFELKALIERMNSFQWVVMEYFKTAKSSAKSVDWVLRYGLFWVFFTHEILRMEIMLKEAVLQELTDLDELWAGFMTNSIATIWNEFIL